ncbi:hypothetical protein H2198_004465 [Neophaeococcomyces mojaviensis]|uniref:Uncharacterized protein n=1 Tax=Neophaeococcomyces mojaviensis TaxID=3383035 RepID=A0ACC3A906_9EURO|nr:hypothetical protein H2198_004465 [Knufia sp. JES_112]
MNTFLHQKLSFFLQPLFGEEPDLTSITTALALGAVAGIALPASARFFSWIRLHFLHQSKISHYHHIPQPVSTSSTTSALASHSAAAKTADTQPWALITGGSDGIGAGFVQELASHNFNIILHGRNPAKISKQIASFRSQYPHLRFECWIADATDRSAWPAAFATLFQLIKDQQIYLTVLVNNIGGNPVPDRSFTALSEYEEDEVTEIIDMNLTFPTQLTRVLLPHLMANKPSLVLNMSSAVALSPIPYLCLYAPSKAFNLQFSKTLRLELVAEGHEEVEVLGVTAGRVKSAGSGDVEVNWLTPTSRDFARSTVRLVGCGREEVVGWWSHGLLIWAMDVLPYWARDRILVLIAKTEKQAREKAE